MPSIRTRRAVIVFLAGMLATHVFLGWRVRRWVAAGLADFTSMYTAGKMVRQGMSHQIYDEQTEWAMQRAFSPVAGARGNSLPYVHAPFEALWFVPFSVDSYLAAYFSWAAVNAALLLLLYSLLKPQFTFVRQRSLASWMFLLMAYFPLFFTILQGQDSIVLLVLYAVVFLCMKRNSWFLAGGSLALGLFRLHLVLPFVAIMLLLKKWKFVAGFGLGSAALAAVSALVVGWRGVWRYPTYIWSLEQHRGKEVILPPAAHSNLRGLIEGSLEGWLQPSLILTLIIIASLVAVLLAAKIWKGADPGDARSTEIGFSASLIVTVLVSFHGFMYDLALLILPAIMVLDQFLERKGREPGALGPVMPIAILFFTPMYLVFVGGKIHHNLVALVLLWWVWALGRRFSARVRLHQPTAFEEAHV
jgi:hypothetical protein